MAELLSNPKPLPKPATTYNFVQEGDPARPEKWTPDFFKKVYGEFDKLANIDTSTEEGAKAYAALVPVAKDHSAQARKEGHSKLVEMAAAGLQANTLKNLGKVIGILDDRSASLFALGSPAFKLEGAGNDKYNAAADAISEFRKISNDVEKDKDAYWAARTKDYTDDASRKFLDQIKDIIIHEDRSRAQRKAQVAIVKYGSSKDFVKKNIERAVKLSNDADSKREEVENAVLKLEAARDTPFTALEREKAEGDARKAREDYFIADQALPNIIGSLNGSAYGVLSKPKK